MYFLTKLIVFILPCTCTIWSSTVIIFQILQDVFGSLKVVERNGNAGVTTANYWSCKYKSNIIGDVATDGALKDVKIAIFGKHWKCSAHSFAKVWLLTAYLSVNRFDIICLSETFVNSENSNWWWEFTDTWLQYC